MRKVENKQNINQGERTVQAVNSQFMVLNSRWWLATRCSRRFDNDRLWAAIYHRPLWKAGTSGRSLTEDSNSSCGWTHQKCIAKILFEQRPCSRQAIEQSALVNTMACGTQDRKRLTWVFIFDSIHNKTASQTIRISCLAFCFGTLSHTMKTVLNDNKNGTWKKTQQKPNENNEKKETTNYVQTDSTLRWLLISRFETKIFKLRSPLAPIE